VDERLDSEGRKPLVIGGITHDPEEAERLMEEPPIVDAEEEQVKPTVKRRRRPGRPRKRPRAPTKPPGLSDVPISATPASGEAANLDDIADLTDQEASSLDFDSWINKFPWETGQYSLKIHRRAPTTTTIAGKRVDISGWLHEQSDLMSEGEISNTFGGKTLFITIVGPDPRTKKVRALGAKRLQVAGAPRLAPNSVPHEMWQTLKPLLIEAGELEEETAMEEEIEPRRRLPFGFRGHPGEGDFDASPFRRPPDAGRSITRDAVTSLHKAFEGASKLSQSASDRALAEKERLFDNQEMIFEQAAKRMEDVQGRLERERDLAVQERDSMRAERENERAAFRKELDTIRVQMLEEQTRLKEDASKQSAEAMSTGLDFMKFMFPAQAENSRTQIDGLIRTYEQRLSAAEQSYQRAIESERKFAETRVLSLESGYKAEISSLRETIKRLEEERRHYDAKVDSLRDNIQNMLNAQLAQASGKGQMQTFGEQMSIMTSMMDTLKGFSGANAPTPEDLSTPGGIFGKVMETVNNVAPSIAGAIAAGKGAVPVEQNPALPAPNIAGMPPEMQQQMQMQQMQQQQALANMPQAEPVDPNFAMPQPPAVIDVPPEPPKKPKIKVDKKLIASALDALAAVWRYDDPPTPETVANIARGVVSSQPENLVNLLVTGQPDKLIRSFTKYGLIPEKLQTDAGVAFIKQILAAIREARNSL